MNRYVFIFIALLFACNNSNINNEVNKKESKHVIDYSSMRDSAMMYLDSAHYFVSKAVKKEINKKQANRLADSYMKEYFRIYKSLPEKDTLWLYNYRIKKINELIDLQIEYGN